MKRRSLYFEGPGQVAMREETCPPAEPDQFLVQTALTGVSAGTEMLVYRGEFPSHEPLDATIPALSASFAYPLMYGYSNVGEVIDRGARVNPEWGGRRVFSFQPHTSHFTARPEDLLALPADITFEQAVFLPNMETALSLVLDGAPLVGENVAIFGQGVVGLLTTALLARFPLNELVTFDPYPQRRQASLLWGATASLDPFAANATDQTHQYFPNGADLTFELSGSPPALNQAIALTGFSGRVLVGSWYGRKPVHLDLGGKFHRQRIRILSSQVSTIAPHLSGRWSKDRRFELAWEMIRKLEPSRLITHRFPIRRAETAYQLLDQDPGEVLGLIFEY
jgi:2-desacetyl-2-hydroxyethyl bacteriochlorophyllide A dehydrogenase